MITLICVLVLMARAMDMNPDTEPKAGPDTNPTTTPTPLSITLIFDDQSTIVETLECLKDFEQIKQEFAYVDMTYKDLVDPSKPIGEIYLMNINSLADYARFKALWAAEGTPSDGDLTPEEFKRFFTTAKMLKIKGASQQRFAANMVKRGLLGEHSIGTIDEPSCYSYRSPGGQELAKAMLLEFAAQVKLKVKVKVNDEELLFYPLGGWETGELERTDSPFKNVSSVEDIMMALKVRLVGLIPPASVTDPTDRAAVFGWLLCHADLLSLSVRHIAPHSCFRTSTDLPAELFTALKKNLPSIIQQYGGKRVVVEEVDLLEYKLEFAMVRTVMNMCPRLKKVGMWIQDKLYESDLELVNDFPELEWVCIHGALQNTSLIKQLTAKAPNLKSLELKLEKHPEEDTMDFSGCAKLEMLAFLGTAQPSSFIQQLLKSVPKIKRLCIQATPLDDAVASSFSNCPNLVRLKIVGDSQTNSFVSKLMKQILEVSYLTLKLGVLDGTIGAILSNYSKVVMLEVYGDLQSGFLPSVYQTPLTNSLRKLTVHTKYGSRGQDSEDYQVIREGLAKGIGTEIHYS